MFRNKCKSGRKSQVEKKVDEVGERFKKDLYEEMEA